MSAIRKMIDQLNTRNSKTSGYVTNAAELSEILKELSPLVSVGITDKRHPMDTKNGLVAVSVKMDFLVHLDELEEYEKSQEAKGNSDE